MTNDNPIPPDGPSALAPASPPPAPNAPRVPREWLAAIGLALVTLILYWPATRCDFVNFDDPVYVTLNRQVLGGLTASSIGWAFTTGAAANWHPMTWLSLMLDIHLFGAKAAGFHFTNIALHAANTALLFWLLRRMTGALWRSAAVAALFAWHPVHVESVAWISERKDVLSTFFGFLSLILYTRHARQRVAIPNVSYFLSLCCFALGLMSKPMLVTWPFLLLLLDYWPLNGWQTRRRSALLAEKIPFLALAAVSSVVTFLVQRHGGVVITVQQDSVGMRLGNALVAYGRYLGKLFWPRDLAVFYPFRGFWPAGELALAGLSLAGISVVFWARRRREPFLFVGWLWFLGTLVPVIGLVQVAAQSMADRYAYIPSVGIFITIVWGGHELIQGRRGEMTAWAWAGAAALLLCLAATRRQLGYWQSSETLFRHAMTVTKDNYIAHHNLGVALAGEGQGDAAIQEFQEAIRIDPGYTEAHCSLGSAYLKKGWFAQSVAEFQEAIRLRPGFADAHYDLGVALTGEKRNQAAIGEFQEAVRLEPDFANARNNLGIALAREGRVDEAISQFQEAIRLEPDYAGARRNLDRALELKSRTSGPGAARP